MERSKERKEQGSVVGEGAGLQYEGMTHTRGTSQKPQVILLINESADVTPIKISKRLVLLTR